MKRAGNLWEKILERDNLRLAYWKALRGKRSKTDARIFGQSLEDNLSQMADGLRNGTYPLGIYHQFTIYDPKERVITAPCFRERVLHHAVMNVCEPVFERWLIYDSYACRRGKGRVAALHRARHFAGRQAFFLKMDIRKYFAGIAHDRLHAKLCRLFKDKALLRLFQHILQSYEGGGRGLPIGSLTSQHFANFFLGYLDRYVKEQLRATGYIRYMDDFAIWHDCRRQLKEWQERITSFLRNQLDLEPKRNMHINRTEHGMNWLGCRVYRRHVTLNSASRRRLGRKLQGLETKFHEGKLSERELQQRAQPLLAYSQSGGAASWRVRHRLLKKLAGKQP